MRNFIWRWLTSRQEPGALLGRKMLIARAVLYPLDTFYWRMNRTRGYQWQSDTWIIEGVRYTGKALRDLARSQGETYRIERVNDYIVLKKLPG